MAALCLWLAAAPLNARAETDPSAAFTALPAGERALVQISLIVTDGYSGVVDGLFGPRTLAAITAFERREGDTADGILTDAERERLHDASTRELAEVDFRFVEDPRSGLSVGIPFALVDGRTATATGTRWGTDPDGFVVEAVAIPVADGSAREVRRRLSARSSERRIDLDVATVDGFILAGRQEGRSFFIQFTTEPEHTRGVSVSWPADAPEDRSRMARVVAATFAPLAPPTPDESEPERLPRVSEPAPSTPNRPAAAITRRNQISTGDFGIFALSETDPGTVVMRGQITLRSPFTLKRILAAHPGVDTIAFDSSGGLVYPALTMALDIHARRMRTRVPEGFRCLSACAFMHLAGLDRRSDGRLGVHQIWNKTNDAKSSLATMADVLDALALFGVDDRVVSIMLRTPPETMHIFTPDEIASLGIDGRAAASADLVGSSRPDPGGISPDEPLPGADAGKSNPAAMLTVVGHRAFAGGCRLEILANRAPEAAIAWVSAAIVIKGPNGAELRRERVHARAFDRDGRSRFHQFVPGVPCRSISTIAADDGECRTAEGADSPCRVTASADLSDNFGALDGDL